MRFWISWVWFVVSPLALAGVTHPPFQVDNSTLEKSGVTVRVKNGGITPAKMAAYNYASYNFTVFSKTSTSWADFGAGNEVTLTVSGNRPVLVGVFAGSANYLSLYASGSTASVQAYTAIYSSKTSSNIAEYSAWHTLAAAASGWTVSQGFDLVTLDFPTSGSVTYKLRYYVTANTTMGASGRLVAIEL